MYKDRWLRLLLIPAFALFIVHLGRAGTFLEWLSNRDNYYADLIFSLTVTVSCWELVRYIIVRFDAYWPWEQYFFRRILVQIPLTIFAGLLIMLLLGSIYAKLIIQVPLAYIMSPSAELPMGSFWILFQNILYLALYYANFNKQPSPEKQEKRRLIGLNGNTRVPLMIDQISYIFIKDKLVYLRTFDDLTLRSDYNLEELEQLLPATFFRLNRQLIANVDAIESFKTIQDRKIEVMLKPAFDGQVKISQKKVVPFKSWIDY